MSIKFAGIGGQGIQLAGKLLGQAAFRQGLNVSQGVNYEPATSGGLTTADVTLAKLDTEILYPFIEVPDILVVFAQRAWDEFKHTVTENTIVLADYDYVQDFDDVYSKKAHLAFHLPFSAKATEIGSEKVTNVVIIGFISEMLDVGEHFVPLLLQESKPEDAEEYDLLEVAPEHFEDSLIKASPEKFRELNLNAYKVGYQMSLDQDYSKKEIVQL
ncbi:MAG: 2-oxoacid:acceptor oxidoreductase family protein [Candidatus Kariarchaeaceae archaeon]